MGLLNSDAGLRIESPLDKSHPHFVPNGGPGTFIYFQSAIQRASQEAIARHRDNPSGEAVEETDFGKCVYVCMWCVLLSIMQGLSQSITIILQVHTCMMCTSLE